jgi:hypothetical protein
LFHDADLYFLRAIERPSSPKGEREPARGCPMSLMTAAGPPFRTSSQDASISTSPRSLRLLNMIPFGIASVFMIFWGLRADKSGERIWSTALPLALTSLSLALTLLTGSLALTLVLLSLVLLGYHSIKGPFFALVTETLSPAQAAAGIAASTRSRILARAPLPR